MTKLSGLLSSIENKLSQGAKAVEGEVAGAAKKVENAIAKAPGDLFEGVKSAVGGVVTKIENAFDKNVERPFASGKDGFVAIDANGQIVGGQAAGVKVGDLDLPKSPLDSLLHILSGGEKAPVTFTLPDGKTVSTSTDGSGHASLSLGQLQSGGLSQGLDPKKGGLVKVGVSTPNGQGDQANMLVLPKNYDGPIFVCDIDDTLRDTSVVDLAEGKTQEPIPGAKELLESVAAKGIPIVYLSAGPDRIHGANEAFLKQLPPGPLLDRSDMSLADVVPMNSVQASRQGAYKADALAQLEKTYPGAKLFGLGDDKYGDAIAYTEQGATTYIHDVRAGNDNLPADFHGTLTKDYDAKFIAKVGSDLQAAIAKSASFGGTPTQQDELATISKVLDQVSGAKVSPGNTITPYIDGQNAFPEVLKTIDSAKKTLTYETFNYVDGQNTTEQVTQHLIDAAKRGVQVKVLVDAIGGREMLWKKNKDLQKLRDGGVDVRIYNPVDRLSDFTDYHINHRKTIVADGSTAWIGGMNTGDEYFGDPSAPGRMHDVFARVTGPAVQTIAHAFAGSWTADGGSKLPESIANPPLSAPEKGGVPVRIVEHTKDDSNIRATYLALIDNAKTQVNVENSFPMSDDVVASLCAAAERGVKVNYVVGSDEGTLGFINSKNFNKLIDAGVNVYQYPTKIHAKIVSVDGQFACIGSSNVDNASLSRNREDTAVVQDPAWVQQFDKAFFQQDLVGAPQGGKTVQLTKDLNQPLYLKALYGLFSLPFVESYE